VQEPVLWSEVANHLHLNGGKLVFGDYFVQSGEIVVIERQGQPSQVARHAGGFKPRQQMVLEAVVLGQIGRQIPVVPAVITAYGHFVAAGRGAGDADGDGIGLAARTREPGHVGKVVHCDQPFG
jgi:hypothetical protein